MAEKFYMMREPGSIPEGPYSMRELRDMLKAGQIVSEVLLKRASALTEEWRQLGALLAAEPPCPPSYMFWSVISIACCFPFSMVALHQSQRVPVLHADGRYEEAAKASRSALLWNAVFFVTVIVLLVFSWLALRFAWDVYSGATKI